MERERERPSTQEAEASGPTSPSPRRRWWAVGGAAASLVIGLAVFDEWQDADAAQRIRAAADAQPAPSSVDASRLEAARGALQARAWDEALRRSTEVLEHAPLHLEALVIAGTAHRHLQHWAEATPPLERALNVKTTAADPRFVALADFNLAAVLAHQGRFDDAHAHLERALFNDYPLRDVLADADVAVLRERPEFQALLQKLKTLNPKREGLPKSVDDAVVERDVVTQLTKLLADGAVLEARAKADACVEQLPNAKDCHRLRGQVYDRLFEAQPEPGLLRAADDSYRAYLDRVRVEEPESVRIRELLAQRGGLRFDPREHERRLQETVGKNGHLWRCMLQYRQVIPPQYDRVRLSMRVTMQGTVAGGTVEGPDLNPDLRGCLERALDTTRFSPQEQERRLVYDLPVAR